MSTIVIGSSNLKRFYPDLEEKLRKSISMQKCTTMDTFKVRMNELDEDDKGIIISVIENFVCDNVGEAKEAEEIEAKMKQTLEEFVEVLKATATKLKTSKFVVVEPMKRPGVKWYNNRIVEYTKAYATAVQNLGLLNIKLISWDDLPVQTFDDAGVHLVKAAGTRFFVAVMAYAEHFFDIVSVDLVEEAMDDTAGGPVASGSGAGTKDLTLQEQIDRINKETKARRHNDSMVTARILEKLDYDINIKKEDKLIVLGLESKSAMPNEKNEQKKWLVDLVGAAFDSVLPDSSKGVAFVTPGRKIEKGVPTMCEVRMKDKTLAIALRKEFAKQRRIDGAQARVDFGKLFIANSVTLATRVRSDILTAIAKRCSSDIEDFFVIGFTSRPLLQVKRKDGPGQYALTFVDAISRFGAGVTKGELQVAYGRARESFNGQLQQNFVVLHENEGVQREAGVAGPNMVGGKKRGREDGGVVVSAKRQEWSGGARGNYRGRGKK